MSESGNEAIRRFRLAVRTRRTAVFRRTAELVHQSIQNGSPITGSPGQPVDTGNLRASWQLSFPTDDHAMVTTNVKYAQVIEDNLRGARLRSKSGGFHSVKLTIAGFQRLFALARREHWGGK